jgi:hypothetical protein
VHSLEAAASANTVGHFFDVRKVPVSVRRSKMPYSMALCVSLRRPSTPLVWMLVSAASSCAQSVVSDSGLASR